MGTFSYEDADKYGGNGSGGSFFKLENDMDVAKVRILGRDMNDFPGYACHEVKIGDSRKLVNCLREYSDPIDVCPFCAEKMKIVAKCFIPLYNLDTKEVQMWERGKAIFKTLSGYVSRHKDVFSWVTEIERHGKPKDTGTTYQFYDDGKDDDVKLEDFDVPEVLGRYVLDKTAEEMEYFLDHGDFPDDNEDNEEPAVRRRSSRDRDEDDRPSRSSRSSRSRRSSDEEF